MRVATDKKFKPKQPETLDPNCPKPLNSPLLNLLLRSRLRVVPKAQEAADAAQRARMEKEVEQALWGPFRGCRSLGF